MAEPQINDGEAHFYGEKFQIVTCTNFIADLINLHVDAFN